jgi:hypothetical protein
MDDGWEIAGVLLGLAALLAVIVFIIVPLVMISMGVGALFGGGNSIYNYGVAFRRNVRLERA